MRKSASFKVYHVLFIGLLLAFISSCDDNDSIEELPVVTTIEATDVTFSSAKSGGEIISDGQLSITSKGVCWSTSPNPTLDDSFTNDGTGAAAFTSDLSDLQANTMYYYRAYATNSSGTGYGMAYTLTTHDGIVSLTTNSVTAITAFTASCGGTISTDGESPITARGLCWGTGPAPSLLDDFSTDGEGIGTFTSTLTGLSPTTTYYVRAYATNAVGTFYGNELSFTTIIYDVGVFTDSRDGIEYQYTRIGNQVWMAENLKYLPSVIGPGVGSDTNPYYYVYDYDGTNVSEAKATANYSTYGVLYNWPAAMAGSISTNNNPSGVQGVCPSGWHLPSDAEWSELEGYLGGYEVAGGKMKEIGLSHWDSPNEGATNESGFTGLPGGYRSSDGTFYYVGYGGYWWSSTETSTGDAWYRELYYYYGGVARYSDSEYYGFSVRCLRD